MICEPPNSTVLLTHAFFHHCGWTTSPPPCLLACLDWRRDIIAPILKVGALRTLGITLHLLVTTERQPIRSCCALWTTQWTDQAVGLGCPF